MRHQACLRRMPWSTGSGARTFMVGGTLVDDAPDIDVSLGAAFTALWDVPLPPCPDCGGELVWTHSGNTPGAQRCRVCASLFRVVVE